MKRFLRILLLTFILAEFFYTAKQQQEFLESHSAAIQKRTITRELSVGCLYSGNSDFQQKELKSFGEELERQRLLYGFSTEKDDLSMEEIWEDLCLGVSSYLHPDPDRIYDCFGMTNEKAQEILDAGDVDFWLSFGEDAGTFLLSHEKDLTADAFVYGYERSVETRKHHPHLYILNYRNEIAQKLDVYWKLLHFSSLGVVCHREWEEDPLWLDILNEKATDYCYTIHKVYVSEPVDLPTLKEAYGRISAGADCVLITEKTLRPEQVPGLIADVNKEKTATLSLVSEDQVEQGVMMYVKTRDSIEEGIFAAQMLKYYLEGAALANLSPEFSVTPKIYLNQEALENVGQTIPFDAWVLVEKVYREGGR